MAHQINDEALAKMADEAAVEVEAKGMELPLDQYIEYLEAVQEQLNLMLENSRNDLKRENGGDDED